MNEENEDFDPGLCVGCEWCWYGSPRDCPQCRVNPDKESGMNE